MMQHLYIDYLKREIFSHDFPKKLRIRLKGWKYCVSLCCGLTESFEVRARFRRSMPPETTPAHDFPWIFDSTLRNLKQAN